jgi:hypothetical protein
VLQLGQRFGRHRAALRRAARPAPSCPCAVSRPRGRAGVQGAQVTCHLGGPVDTPAVGRRGGTPEANEKKRGRRRACCLLNDLAQTPPRGRTATSRYSPNL